MDQSNPACAIYRYPSPEEVKIDLGAPLGTSTVYFRLTFTEVRHDENEILNVDFSSRDETATAEKPPVSKRHLESLPGRIQDRNPG